MKFSRVLAATLVVTATIAAWPIADLIASGPLGIYGIVEKVVFEPNEPSAQRIQVWGAFVYVDGIGDSNGAVSVAKRGYLYFQLPDVIPGYREQSYIDNVKREWADLKSVAGTGQAVGFGYWGYIAGFGDLQPDRKPTPPAVILHGVPRGGAASDLRVRPATEAPSGPAVYQTNIGIVKLSDTGSRAAVVKQLREALTNRETGAASAAPDRSPAKNGCTCRGRDGSGPRW